MHEAPPIDSEHNWLDVVAAVIERRGRYLLCQRPPRKQHGGLWEFPGGKVSTGEPMAAALARELAEELALHEVDVGGRLGELRDEQQRLRLHFFQVSTRGSPILLEHSALGWFRGAELQGLQLAPLDFGFARAIGILTG